jgi:hypothetical protein
MLQLASRVKTAHARLHVAQPVRGHAVQERKFVLVAGAHAARPLALVRAALVVAGVACAAPRAVGGSRGVVVLEQRAGVVERTQPLYIPGEITINDQRELGITQLTRKKDQTWQERWQCVGRP